MAHITLATPMYGGVCSGAFMKSVLQLAQAVSNAGHQLNFIDLSNESLITRARNTLTEMFLRSMSDYLLFIDADQGFDAQAVVRMINENVDLIGAAVPMKAINWARVKKAVLDGKENLDEHTAIFNVNMNKEQRKMLKENPNTIAEVDYMGTGLMLISRNGSIVFGDPIYDFWQTTIDEQSDRLLSEDYQFCKLWKESGGKIYLAPYVRVSHAGTYWFK